MAGLSQMLRKYPGANPFHESQARSYSDEKIVSEFFPTRFFWSLFNEQHEILLGTRGSGKTILLRMLTYSCLRLFKDATARKHVNGKRYVGFYVPLHLEFIMSLPKRGSDEERLADFQLAFNCIAAKALLHQATHILADLKCSQEERVRKEAEVVDHIAPIWFGEMKGVEDICSISDMEFRLDSLYNLMNEQPRENAGRRCQFGDRLLAPIVTVLPRLASDLDLDPETTHWVACIDEAEFLADPFQKCINTVLRSEHRPLVVKLATQPFRHTTLDTLVADVSISPEGNDFNYRIVDFPWDSGEYRDLCDHICRVRLSKCGMADVTNLTLETFLGVVGQNDDMIDYYRKELPEEASDETILEGIQQALSSRRRTHMVAIAGDKAALGKPYRNKFEPVYFMRRMCVEDRKGARVVGWFAGAKMTRRIADGNPRRFIQIMKALVDQVTRDKELDPKEQHRVLTRFCKIAAGEGDALPKYGPMLGALISRIGELLKNRIHGETMVNGGCHFRLDQGLVDNNNITAALKLGIAFSHVVVDRDSLLHGLTRNSDFRLSFIYGVKYWLPMRKGEELVMRAKHLRLDLGVPMTSREAESTFSQLGFELQEATDEQNSGTE